MPCSAHPDARRLVATLLTTLAVVVACGDVRDVGGAETSTLVAVRAREHEGRAPQREAPAPLRVTRRIDVVIGADGVAASFAKAHVPLDVLDLVDDALATRLDVHALARPATTISVWLDVSGKLAGVSLPVGRGAMAALYDGELAPRGFYDERGLSLAGPLRARPVKLSRVTSKFGERFDPLNGSVRKHRGTDFAVPVGTEVLAAGRGIVRARGKSASAGNFIKLAHASGFESFYLHLDAFEDGIEVGQRVEQSQVIARSGNTGRSTGPHVHYELHLAGRALDAQRTMPIPEAALGPLALRKHRAFIAQLQAMEADR